MGVKKDITMSVFNGTDYDALYPKTKSTQAFVSDKVITDLVLSAGANVDDAFQSIINTLKLITGNVAAITVTVKDSSGNAIPNIVVDGIFSDSGTEVYTNSSGIATGYVAEGEQTIAINYADLSEVSETFTVTRGSTYSKTLTPTRRNFFKITASRSVRFSENVTQVDVTAVGGGGAGGYGYAVTSMGRGYQGGGGGGGYCTVQENVNFSANVNYSAVIGSGGATTYSKGSDGGTSSFLNITANGGKGGYGAGSGGNGSGGEGNGNGGDGATNGVDGSVAGYDSFTTTTIYGGGGAGGYGVSGQYTGGSYGGSSGKPGGNGQNGYGGGGAGGWAGNVDGEIKDGPGGNGGSGCIAIRMHLTIT